MLRSAQAYGRGEYFAFHAITSSCFCKGGNKMIIFAVLTDASGVTFASNAIIVVHKVDLESTSLESMLIRSLFLPIFQTSHQLPLFTWTFRNQVGTQQTQSIAFPNPIGLSRVVVHKKSIISAYGSSITARVKISAQDKAKRTRKRRHRIPTTRI